MTRPRAFIAVLSLLALVAVPTVASASPTVVTFSQRGGGLWTVPSTVTSIVVECWGSGGPGGSGQYGGGGAGGNYVEATVSVTPGQTLWVVVGTTGNSGSRTPAYPSLVQTGRLPTRVFISASAGALGQMTGAPGIGVRTATDIGTVVIVGSSGTAGQHGHKGHRTEQGSGGHAAGPTGGAGGGPDTVGMSAGGGSGGGYPSGGVGQVRITY